MTSVTTTFSFLYAYVFLYDEIEFIQKYVLFINIIRNSRIYITEIYFRCLSI